MKRLGRLKMLNLIVTGKPSDGLFFYSCEHYWRLQELGISVQLIVFTHRDFDESSYLNSVKEKYTKTIPIIFNDYFCDDNEVNLIMGRSMLTLAYKQIQDHDEDKQLSLRLLFKNPLISVYSENHPTEYYDALEFFKPQTVVDLCDHDVYPNGTGKHFAKYIHFDYYRSPIDDIQFEHLFLGTTPEYYDSVQKVLYKYPDHAIIVYNKTQPNHIQAPVKNLLGKFNKYVYVKHTFDPAPRIIQECLYYGKEVIFERPDIADGGAVYWQRGLMKPDVNEIIKAYDEIQRLGH